MESTIGAHHTHTVIPDKPRKRRKSGICFGVDDAEEIPDSAPVRASGMTKGGGYAAAAASTPVSASHSRIFCLGIAPTFIEAMMPFLNSIMVGMPRTP